MRATGALRLAVARPFLLASEVATEDKRLPLKEWWAAIAPGVEPSQNWVELRVSAADDVTESSDDDEAPASPVRKKSVRFEEEW